MSGRTVKAVGWQPQQPPSAEECAAMHPIIVEAVYGLFNESKEPLQVFACHIDEIYRRCQLRVRELRDSGQWSYPYRGRETWKRRMQEAAYEEHGAKIINVKAGFYRPNPKMFASSELEVYQLDLKRPRPKYQKTGQPFRGKPKVKTWQNH